MLLVAIDSFLLNSLVLVTVQKLSLVATGSKDQDQERRKNKGCSTVNVS